MLATAPAAPVISSGGELFRGIGVLGSRVSRFCPLTSSSTSHELNILFPCFPLSSYPPLSSSLHLHFPSDSSPRSPTASKKTVSPLPADSIPSSPASRTSSLLRRTSPSPVSSKPSWSPRQPPLKPSKTPTTTSFSTRAPLVLPRASPVPAGAGRTDMSLGRRWCLSLAVAGTWSIRTCWNGRSGLVGEVAAEATLEGVGGKRSRMARRRS
jgi:hypothetical protein